MYTLVSAIGQSTIPFSRWASVDVSAIPLATLVGAYRYVIFTLTNPSLPAPVALDLAQIQARVAGLPITLPEWLVEIGNETLPTQTPVPNLRTASARYADAWHAGYKIHLSDGNTPVDNTFLSEKKWLYLQKEGVDFAHFYQSVLASVNGYYHRTDYDVNGAYIIDGVVSKDICGHNSVGLLSFAQLGKLRMVPITEEMLYKKYPEQKYQDAVDINLGIDHTTSTVMLVLGGYLHVGDQNVVMRTGPATLRINMGKLSLLERYFESRKSLDLSGLGLSVNPLNPDLVNIEEFFSDTVMRNHFLLSQSFIVLLDNPNVYVAREKLYTPPAPGRFISFTPPLYPLQLGHGRMGDYWYTHEDGQYSIAVNDTILEHYMYSTRVLEELTNVDDACIPATPRSPESFSQAYWLKISADLIN